MIQKFNEFFDTKDLRDQSDLDLDYSSFIKKLFKSKKNKESLKKASQEELEEFDKPFDKDIQNKLIFILRECPLLRSEYFKVKMEKHLVSFLYKYKEGKTSWELIININLKRYSTLVAYVANIYGYDVITKDHKIEPDSIENLCEQINNNLLPMVIKWGKETKNVTNINPIPYKKEDFFSPGNN